MLELAILGAPWGRLYGLEIILRLAADSDQLSFTQSAREYRISGSGS